MKRMAEEVFILRIPLVKEIVFYESSTARFENLLVIVQELNLKNSV